LKLKTCIFVELIRPDVVARIDALTLMDTTTVLASVVTAKCSKNLVLSAVRGHCPQIPIRVLFFYTCAIAREKLVFGVAPYGSRAHAGSGAHTWRFATSTP
jgi:hypothetical protein